MLLYFDQTRAAALSLVELIQVDVDIEPSQIGKDPLVLSLLHCILLKPISSIFTFGRAGTRDLAVRALPLVDILRTPALAPSAPFS
jgi:hypothetical protein